MIKGIHGMLYTPKTEELRAFIRDKLKFTYSDVGEGWLIFDPPEAELGCHPAKKSFHELSFYCDDIQKTVAVLKKRGVRFTGEIQDHGYGLVTHFEMPGGIEMQLYQPKYEKSSRKKKK